MLQGQVALLPTGVHTSPASASPDFFLCSLWTVVRLGLAVTVSV
jgi:hypothetical protein